MAFNRMARTCRVFIQLCTEVTALDQVLPWFVDVALARSSDHFTAATMDARLAPLTIHIMAVVALTPDLVYRVLLVEKTLPPIASLIGSSNIDILYSRFLASQMW